VAKVWHGTWGIKGPYDFVRATFDNDENVPRMPPHRLGIGAIYRDAAWLARINLLHAFRQDEIGIHETPTSGYNPSMPK
jgi:iron complex outermembrane receptor protein